MLLLGNMKKRTKIIIGIGALVIIVAGITVWRMTSGRNETEIRTAKAEIRDVVQDVSFTGQLEAQQAVNLGFEFTGIARYIPVKVGSAVKTGQLLMQLDSQAASLEKAKALADRVSSQDQLYLAWQQAETSWQNTKDSNIRTLEEKRQAVRNAKLEYDQAKDVWQQKVRESGEESSIAKAAYSTVLLEESTYKSAQDALSTSLKSLEATEQDSRDAADAAKAKYLASTQASSSNASLSSLEALEQAANVKLSKTSLISPFDGIVTEINAEAGEVVTAGASIITVQTIDKLQVRADVPETDAAKLSSGQTAVFTFDAMSPDQEWSGEVSTIAPAAKVIDGIPTYETVILLTSPIEKLKPGLTTNVIVHADRRSSVIAVPSRTIITKEGRKYVRIQTAAEATEEKEIKVGLAGSDGWTEVTEGLSGGENIVIETPES